MKKRDFFVLEVSSFHLDIAPLPDFEISVLLNISPDHLDRHKSFDNYIKVKDKLNHNSKISIINKNLKKYIPHADYFFDCEGSVKKQNLLAISKVCSALNLSYSEEEILSCFPQLPHRMENFHNLDGDIVFIDDSKATNVSSALEGLKSIDQSKSLIVICGGRSKNQDLKDFTNFLNHRATNIFYFGESIKTFKKLLDKSKAQPVNNLDEAVDSAFKVLKKYSNDSFASMFKP